MILIQCCKDTNPETPACCFILRVSHMKQSNTQAVAREEEEEEKEKEKEEESLFRG